MDRWELRGAGSHVLRGGWLTPAPGHGQASAERAAWKSGCERRADTPGGLTSHDSEIRGTLTIRRAWASPRQRVLAEGWTRVGPGWPGSSAHCGLHRNLVTIHARSAPTPPCIVAPFCVSTWRPWRWKSHTQGHGGTGPRLSASKWETLAVPP